MKRNDLNAIITGIVHRYIEDGWVLEMDNASYSDVVGVHFLSRGRERVAVGIRRPELKEVTESGRYANLRGLDSRILFECRAPKGSFDWVELGNVISERVFFKVDGDWYVDDAREADGAKAKRRERARRDFYRNASPRSFHPTKAFLDKWVREMYGWKNVKPSDVIIAKETCAEGIITVCGRPSAMGTSSRSRALESARRGTGGAPVKMGSNRARSSCLRSTWMARRRNCAALARPTYTACRGYGGYYVSTILAL